MKISLVHTLPNTSKIDPFSGTFVKRWKERVYSAIDVVNLGHILIDPKPKSDSKLLSKWESWNKSEEIVAIVSFEVRMVTNIINWIVDSRATRHICGNRNAFTSYTMVK